MNKVTAVICSHNNLLGLEGMCTQMEYQTMVPDEIIVLGSGYAGNLNGYGTYARHVPDYNDYGHTKRAMGLMLATSEYVGFMNDDDMYEPEFIETLYNTAKTNDLDIVACDYYDKIFTDYAWPVSPQIDHIIAGSFLVRTEFAQYIGYNHRSSLADGAFIEDLIAAGAKFQRVDKALYHHR